MNSLRFVALGPRAPDREDLQEGVTASSPPKLHIVTNITRRALTAQLTGTIVPEAQAGLAQLCFHLGNGCRGILHAEEMFVTSEMMERGQGTGEISSDPFEKCFSLEHTTDYSI